MAPAPKSILKASKPVRKVVFNSFCEVRTFGNTFIESDKEEKKPTVLDFRGYKSYNIDEYDDDELNKTIRGNPEDVEKEEHFNDVSMLAHDGVSPLISSIFKPAKSLNTPLRKISVQLLKKKEKKALAVQKAKKFARMLKICHGVWWTKPTALKRIRGDWRFDDEMESDGEIPADNELDSAAVDEERKKKLLTTVERYQRQVSMRSAQDRKKHGDNVREFIRKIKKGEAVTSIGQNGNIDSDVTPFFGQMCFNFLEELKKEPRVINFKVKAYITRRLAIRELDFQIRLAYEAILQNYDEVLGSYLYHFFCFKKAVCFEALEKLFLLG